MQGDKFIYYLRNRTGDYYYVDNLNSVQVSAAPVPLRNTPDGWSKAICGMARSEEYYGTFTKFTTPLEFVGDGKRIVDTIAINEGPSGYIDLYVRVQKSIDFSYEDYFSGPFDLRNIKVGDIKTTCNVNEAKVLAALDAKKNVVVEIQLTSANSVEVQLDGVVLKQRAKYDVFSDFEYSFDAWTAIVSEAGVDGTSANGISGSQVYEQIPGPMLNYTRQGDNAFFTNIGPSDIALQVTIAGGIVSNKNGTSPLSGGRVLIASSRDNGFGGPVEYNIINVGQMQVGQNYTFNFNQTIIVQPTESLYIVGRQSSVNFNQFSFQFAEGTNMNIEFTSRYKATIHRAIFPGVLWRLLVNKLTDGKYAGYSSFLDSDKTKLLIPASSLRGDGRNILKTSIEDFLKYVYAVHTGVVTDGASRAEIRPRSDTYIATQGIDVGEVANLEWQFDSAIQIGNIKGGYEKQNLGYDTANGRFDFHAGVQWTTGQENIKNTYDFTCPYIASMYAIEVMRIKYASKPTTDNDNDNSVYILDVKQGVDRQYYTGQFQVVAGNVFVLPGTQAFIATGGFFKITGTANYNGTYTVQNVSYLVAGATRITVTQAVTPGNDNGTFTTADPNIYGPNRPAYLAVQGLLDPASAFNIELSPAHLLRLHGPYIYGGIYNATANPQMGIVKFQSGEKNTDLSVTTVGGIIKISADVGLPSLGVPFYIPVTFTMQAKYQDDVFQYLKTGSNRYRYVSFTWKGNRYNGYIIELNSNADTREPQQWQLLAIIGTNLSNLLIT